MRWNYPFSHKRSARQLQPSISNPESVPSAMTYSSFSVQEPQVLSIDYYPAPSVDSYDTVGVFEEPPSLFDSIFSSSYSYGNKVVDFTTSPQSEAELVEEDYDEGEELSSYGQHADWLSEYCSSLGGGYGLLYSGADKDNGFGSSHPNEEQFNFNDYINRQEYQQEMEHVPSREGIPWPHQGSWLGYGGEEDSDEYGKQEPKHLYSYSPDEMEIFQSLFGYWPCMLHRDQITYNV